MGVGVGGSPAPREDPALERALEVIAERVGVAAGAGGAFGGAVGRVGSVGTHGIDPVEVVGVDGETGVVGGGRVLIVDFGDQGVVDPHPRRGAAVDGVVREEGIVAARPGETDGVRGDVVENRWIDHGWALGDRDVVNVPAVGGGRRIGGGSEADEHVVRECERREFEASSVPVPGGAVGVGGERGPGGASVGRDLDVARVAGKKVPGVDKAQNRVRRGGQVDGADQGQALRVDEVAVISARRVRPRVAAGEGALGGKRPRRIGGPCGVAALTVVEEGVVHAGRGRCADLVAQTVELVGGHDHDPVEISLLGGHCDVGVRGGPDGGDLGDEGRRSPVEAGAGPAVHAVGEEPRVDRCAPREINRVRRHDGRRGQGDSRRRLGDEHVVDVPAVGVDGAVGDDVESNAHVVVGRQRREVDLLARPRCEATAVGCHRSTPRNPAVGRGLHVGEVAPVLELVAVLETKHRCGCPRQVDGGPEAQRCVHRDAIESQWTVGDGVDRRGVERRGFAPRRVGGPVGQSAFEVIAERVAGGPCRRPRTQGQDHN